MLAFGGGFAPSLPYVRSNGQRVPGIALTALFLTLAVAAPGGASPTPAASGSATPKVSPVLFGLSTAAPAPTPAGIARALASGLTDPGLGGDPHVEVIDAQTGKVLLDHLGKAPAIPASTQKLMTAAAALTVLGPRTRFTTRVLASGSDLYLVGGGDPTLSTQPQLTGYPPSADLNTLAAAVSARHKPVQRVIAVAPDYGGPDEAAGWSPSYLTEGEAARVRSLVVDEAKLSPGLGPSVRTSDPVLSAANAFRATLAAAGVTSGEATVGALAKGATLVASVKSPPVSALVERMLTYSDADIAEGLGRQVARKLHKPATFEGTAQALQQVTRTLGLPGGSQFADASGLSRSNAIAPATITALLRLAAQGTHPELRSLLAALPIAGFTGTLAQRFTGSASVGAGVVRAKTGWLNGAAALAGVVTTADHRQLIFAALTPAYARYAGESALDRLAATLATCGCR
jgi:D-alanyl-D-alanine carboxypeptidase/D-alanyl-D-alanine-endopeptidase (penicillin-binding protein 4)